MSMNITTMPYINTIDNDGKPLMRPCMPHEEADGTWFVFTDKLLDGEEFGVMMTWTEVVTEVPDHILDTVEKMMDTYRRDHGEHS